MQLLVGAFNQEKALVKTPWPSLLYDYEIFANRCLTFVSSSTAASAAFKLANIRRQTVQTVQEIKYVCVLVMRIYLDTEATFSLSCAKQN